MNLTEFISTSQEELAKFKNHYLEQHELDPSSWPLDMNPGDWFEQFVMWTGDR